MPKTPAQHHDIGYYLSGYTDGEGSFCVSFSPRVSLRTKVEVRPSFSVSQNGDRREVLNMFLEYFQCLHDLCEKIIPHFEQFPLFSSKQKDFEKFKVICGWMYEEQHKSAVSLKRLIEFACSMNTSGTRKYSKEYLLYLIL